MKNNYARSGKSLWSWRFFSDERGWTGKFWWKAAKRLVLPSLRLSMIVLKKWAWNKTFCDVFVTLASSGCVGGHTLAEPPTLGLKFCNRIYMLRCRKNKMASRGKEKSIRGVGNKLRTKNYAGYHFWYNLKPKGMKAGSFPTETLIYEYFLI